MAYATVGMVTDFDCWSDEVCSLQQIMQVMKTNYLSSHKLIKSLVPSLLQDPIQYVRENESIIVTKKEAIPEDYQEKIKVLIGDN